MPATYRALHTQEGTSTNTTLEIWKRTAGVSSGGFFPFKKNKFEKIAKERRA